MFDSEIEGLFEVPVYRICQGFLIVKKKVVEPAKGLFPGRKGPCMSFKEVVALRLDQFIHGGKFNNFSHRRSSPTSLNHCFASNMSRPHITDDPDG
jgi:hypothetical protein